MAFGAPNCTCEIDPWPALIVTLRVPLPLGVTVSVTAGRGWQGAAVAVAVGVTVGVGVRVGVFVAGANTYTAPWFDAPPTSFLNAPTRNVLLSLLSAALEPNSS